MQAEPLSGLNHRIMALILEWYNARVEDSSWRRTLARTRRTALGRLASLLGTSDLTPEFWEGLEASLIQADLGVKTTLKVLASLQAKAKSEAWTNGAQVRPSLQRMLVDRFEQAKFEALDSTPRVVLLIGVNGSGKTTFAARLAHRWVKIGRSVLLAAADTYRAAAGEQLQIWGQRLGVDVISGQQGSDPGAVVYSAAQAALARGIDDLIVDSSGRMHTHHNLMAELEKICRVAGKVVPGGPHLVLLILDATTGQNGISQARAFTQSIDVDGVAIAKLDSSAKGGIAVSISDELGLPVLYVGYGENLEDLASFDPEAFVDALLPEGGQFQPSA